MQWQYTARSDTICVPNLLYVWEDGRAEESLGTCSDLELVPG